MLDATPLSDLNSSTKRPRTMSTPTSDKELPQRQLSRMTATASQANQATVAGRERPTRGVQFHEIVGSMPTGKNDIAAASGVPHYLVPFKWWAAFIRHVKDMEDAPPDLDLSLLDEFMDGKDLRADIEIGRDVQVLQVETWSKIQQWYGKEDEMCVRHSYKQGPGHYVIEFRPSDLYFSLYSPPNQFSETRKISMYKYKDVEGLYEKVRHAFDIDASHQIRFWHTTESEGLTNLNTAKSAITKTYDRVSIGTVTDGSTSFIVETRKNGSEKWPLELSKKAQISRARPLGIKGLINLGNTCYMASALQCLSHVKELTDYFLSDCYKSELNTDNPLGYSGRVANAFAKLLEQLYSSDTQRSVAPRELKTVLGNINSSFGGYQQQDSQELLAFLLDALHEDLNRIVKKPATQRPDIGKVSDEKLLVLGEEAWNIHKMRNDSVIVDLFQGIYKSTLVCPVCAHVSVTFDPFSDLSLPLPFRSYWCHDIHFVPLSGSIKKMTIELEQNASIGHLIAYLSKQFHVPASNIAGAEVWKHKFYKVYENYMPVTTIEKSDDAFFYELSDPDPRVDKDSKNIWVPIYTYKKGSRSVKMEECALPMVLMFSITELKSYDTIRRKVLHSYTRFTTSRDLTSMPAAHDLHPERSYDSDQDTSKADSADPVPSVTSTSQSAATQPFTIKVAPAKGTTSFYDRREPVPLLDRAAKLSGKLVSKLDSLDALPNAVSIRGLDDLPAYDDIAGPNVLTESADPQLAMKDDSDSEDAMAPASQRNLDLVDRYLHGDATNSEAPRDSLPTPDSSPEITTAPDVPETPTEETLLINDGDALHCEWTETAYGQIFSEESDTIAGKSLWEDFVIVHDADMDAERAARESSKDNVKSLEDCLDEFSKEEPLDAENTWYCPKCKEHQRANKTFELWRSGDILVFHLKRFSNSRSLSDKIDAEIRFPITGLNMSNRLGERKLRARSGESFEDSIYDLTGVVNHYGGLGGGHYTAFAQTFDSEGYRDFHNFNGNVSLCFLAQPNSLDSSVNSMDPGSLISSSAYLLFYRRRSENPLGGDLDEKIKKCVAEQESLSQERAVLANGVRDLSLPPNVSPPSDYSPATSSSGGIDTKVEPYVPFLGPGRLLGGEVDSYVRSSQAPASNPFSGAQWGSHAPSRFATTNSETSERNDEQSSLDANNENDDDDAMTWPPSD